MWRALSSVNANLPEDLIADELTAAISAMLDDFAGKLSCPVYRGFPYGHKPDHFVLDFHRTAVIRDDTLTFELPDRPLPYRKKP